MKRILLIFVFTVAAAVTLALTGCTNGVAGVARALAKDPATVSVKINTIYGTASLVRVGVQTNNSVTVSPDGTVTIKPGS